MTRIRRRLAIPALLAALILIVLGAPARASVDVDAIASKLDNSPVYVSPGVQNLLPRDDARQVAKAAEQTGDLYFIVV